MALVPHLNTGYLDRDSEPKKPRIAPSLLYTAPKAVPETPRKFSKPLNSLRREYISSVVQPLVGSCHIISSTVSVAISRLKVVSQIYRSL